MAGDTLAAAGFFVAWEGNARSTRDPGGGHLCEVDPVAKYIAVNIKNGTLMHEGGYFRTMEAIAKAFISAVLVAGAHPWGKPSEGF